MDSVIALPEETPSEDDFQTQFTASVSVPRRKSPDDRCESPDDKRQSQDDEHKIPDIGHKSPDNSLYLSKLEGVTNSASFPNIGMLGKDDVPIMSPACSSRSLLMELANETKPLDMRERENKESVFSLDSGLGTEENGGIMKRQSKERDGDVRMGCSVSALAQSLKETEKMGMDSCVDIQLAERFSELETVVLPRYSQSEETEESER